MANIGANINYPFGHFRTGITAFVAMFEKRVQVMIPEIPVFIHDTGDQTYWLRGKWESGSPAGLEMYQKVPRVVFKFSDFNFQTDQNTSQYVKFNYKTGGEIFRVQGRRTATEFPMEMSMVCPNFPWLLDAAEAMGSMMSVDNVFTYDYLGNTYDGSFSASSFSTDNSVNGQQSSESTNPILKATTSVVMQPWFIRPQTIQSLSEASPSTTIEIRQGEPPYIDAINPTDPDDQSLTKNKP